MNVQETSGPTYSASHLLRKAQHLGLASADDLAKLAVVRGLRYYDGANQGETWKKEAQFQIPTTAFSNAELAIALLSPDWPADNGSAVQVRQRIASAVLSADDVDPVALAELAKAEKSSPFSAGSPPAEPMSSPKIPSGKLCWRDCRRLSGQKECPIPPGSLK